MGQDRFELIAQAPCGKDSSTEEVWLGRGGGDQGYVTFDFSTRGEEGWCQGCVVTYKVTAPTSGNTLLRDLFVRRKRFTGSKCFMQRFPTYGVDR